MKNLFSRYIFFLPVLLFPFILFGEAILTGRVLFWGVSSLQFIPWRSLALQSLEGGQIPFWNPYNGLGSPLLANYQLAFFYPPNWIQYLFYLLWGTQGVAISYNWLIPLHMVWAGAGMLLFMKEIKVSQVAQALAAISFSLCGYIVARISFISILWTLAWLPWLMYLSTRMVTIGLSGEHLFLKNIWLPICSLSAVCAMMFLAGHAQTSWYSLLIAAGWTAFYGFSRRRWKGFGIGAGFYSLSVLIATMLASIQLIPTFEFFIQSQRSAAMDFAALVRYSFWPWRLVTFILPGFFGNPGNGSFWGYGNYWEDACYLGLLPLFFAFYAVFRLFYKPRIKDIQKIAAYYFVIIALLGTFLALGDYTPIYRLLYLWIPSFNMFQAPSRWIILTIFFLASLAGIGLDQWMELPPNRKRMIFWGMIALGGIIAGIFIMKFIPTLPSTMAISIVGQGVFALIFIVLLYYFKVSEKITHKTMLLFSIISLVGIDLVSANFQMNPVTSNVLYSNVKGEAIAPIAQARTILSTMDEYDLKFTRFFRIADFRPIEDWVHLRLVDLPNINILDQVSYINNFDPMVSLGYQKIIDLLNQSSIELKIGLFNQLNVGTIERLNIQKSTGITLLKIADSRYSHSYSCESISPMGYQKIRGGEGEFFDPNHPVFTIPQTKQVVANNCQETYQDSYSGYSGNLNSLAFFIDLPVESWLELSTGYYPGWHAWLDNSEIPVFLVNGVFLGLRVPAGNHTLRIEFSPSSFNIGALISAISILFLVVITCISVRKTGKGD